MRKLFARIRWSTLHLTAHAASDWELARAYEAQRNRAEPLMGMPRWLAR